jgi:hypothetical protein
MSNTTGGPLVTVDHQGKQYRPGEQVTATYLGQIEEKDVWSFSPRPPRITSTPSIRMDVGDVDTFFLCVEEPDDPSFDGETFKEVSVTSSDPSVLTVWYVSDEHHICYRAIRAGSAKINITAVTENGTAQATVNATVRLAEVSLRIVRPFDSDLSGDSDYRAVLGEEIVIPYNITADPNDNVTVSNQVISRGGLAKVIVMDKMIKVIGEKSGSVEITLTARGNETNDTDSIDVHITRTIATDPQQTQPS